MVTILIRSIMLNYLCRAMVTIFIRPIMLNYICPTMVTILIRPIMLNYIFPAIVTILIRHIMLNYICIFLFSSQKSLNYLKNELDWNISWMLGMLSKFLFIVLNYLCWWEIQDSHYCRHMQINIIGQFKMVTRWRRQRQTQSDEHSSNGHQKGSVSFKIKRNTCTHITTS
jgi:hypothetical protein